MTLNAGTETGGGYARLPKALRAVGRLIHAVRSAGFANRILIRKGIDASHILWLHAELLLRARLTHRRTHGSTVRGR